MSHRQDLGPRARGARPARSCGSGPAERAGRRGARGSASWTGASRAPCYASGRPRSRGLPTDARTSRAKMPSDARRRRVRTSHEPTARRSPSTQPRPPAPRILLYSDDVDARAQVRLAVGRRLRRGAPDIEWVEVATRRGRHRDDGGRRARPADPRRRGRQGRRPGARAPAQGRDLPLPPDRSCSPVGRRTPGWRPGRTPTAVVSRPLDPVELHAAVAALVEARAVTR